MKKTKTIKSAKTVSAETKTVSAEFEGLYQGFIAQDGKTKVLKDLLVQGDWWELKGAKTKAIIVTHNAVKKIADVAGLRTDPEYTILTQPDIRNNYQNTWQVRICDQHGRCTTEIGEANKDNTGSRGRNNLANMAQKRAYDRAVFRHLGITGFLGEDELQDEEQKNKQMNNLTPDEAKPLVPLLNEIINAKSRKELLAFSAKMKKDKAMLTERQLVALREAWSNMIKVIESKTQF